jgi:hypothetical protein
VVTVQEARKYFKGDISDERLEQIVGYLQGMVEMVIKQEREKYEQEIKKRYPGEKIKD